MSVEACDVCDTVKETGHASLKIRSRPQEKTHKFDTDRIHNNILTDGQTRHGLSL